MKSRNLLIMTLALGVMLVRCAGDEQPKSPSVKTQSASEVGYTSFKCGGNIKSAGASDLLARGLCWGLEKNPTIDDEHSNEGTDTGEFNSKVTGLKGNTTYHVRAYATNTQGTSYGADIEVKTLNGLLAHYTFDNQGTDQSGNHFDLNQNGTSYGSGRKGNPNGSLCFNGINASASSMLDFGNNPIDGVSVSVWVYSQAKLYYCIDGIGFALDHDSSGDFYFSLTGGITVSVRTPLNLNEWHHIVGTYDRGTKRATIYVDGVAKNSLDDSSMRNFGSGSVTYGTNGTEHWKGYLDDLRYYKYVLSQSEIEALFNE